jgi:hypothetical protein
MNIQTIDKEQIQVYPAFQNNEQQLVPIAPITTTLAKNCPNLVNMDWKDSASFGGLPMLLHKVDVPEIDYSFLPLWITAQAQVISKLYRVPIGGVAILALTNLSACVQNLFSVAPYDDCSHIEPIGIMTLVASTVSSDKKIIDALTKPIVDLEKVEMETTLRNADDNEVIQKFYKGTTHAILRKAIKTEVEAQTENQFWGLQTKDSMHQKAKGLVYEAMGFNNQRTRSIMVPKKIFSNDITEKSLPIELVQNYGKIAIISNDSNLLKVMSSSIFLQAYSGGSLKVKTKNGYEFMDTTSVAAGLIIPPETMQLKSKSQSVDCRKELLSKSLYYFPESNFSENNNDQIEIPAKSARQLYEAVIEIVLNLQPSFTFDEFTNKHLSGVIKLSNEARESWLQFSKWIESEAIYYSQLELLRDWLKNLPWIALRIAGLIHIAQSIKVETGTLSSLSNLSSEAINNLSISKEVMDSAAGLCIELIAHAQAAYGFIEGDKSLADIDYTINWILKNAECNAKGEFYIRKTALLYDNHFKNSEVSKIEKILEILCEMHIVSPIMKIPIPFKTNICFVNPEIFKLEIKEKLSLMVHNPRQLALAS